MKALSASLLSLAIVGAGAGGFFLFGQPPEVPKGEVDEESGPLVRTETVTSWDHPVMIDMDGDANSFRVITVGAQVRGQIKRKSPQARSGLFVRKGEVLFEIDDTNYRLDIERLDAQLNQATEEMRSVEVNMQNSKDLIALAEEDLAIQKRQIERVEKLFRTKSTSEADVDAAKRQELTARNALQNLQNTLRTEQQTLKEKVAAQKLVEAQLRRARTDLERCVVKSSLAGRIVDDIVEQGDFINDGEPLVHISDSSKMDVQCNLRSDDLVWLLQQLRETAGLDIDVSEAASIDPMEMPPVPCEVAYDFEGTEVIWDGFLSRFDGTGMDRDTRTFPCRITVPEPSQYRTNDSPGAAMSIVPPSLMSGMFVTVRIPITVSAGLLRVPAEAVRPGGRVWVVRDKAIRIHRVSVARTDDSHVLIRADETDVLDGDQVVVSPMVTVQDDMEVRLENRP